MAGMRALGRVYNVVPNASGLAICLRDCSGVGLVAAAGATATGTLTFTAATSFAGTYVNLTPANGFGQPNTWYLATAAGTAAWAAQVASWSTNVLTIGATSGNVSYLDYLVSELADGYDYVKVTAGANVALTAILYDLTVQRIPANLRLASA